MSYREKLRRELEPKVEALCPDCQERLKVNPLRVFDCKNKTCIAILAEAPKITDNLCDDCREHLSQVENLIASAGLKYRIDPTLVRGFDYYTRTTFEIKSPLLGAQNALGGGGRYDNLVAQYGGPSTPAIGFALGVERILLGLKEERVELDLNIRPDVFIAVVEDSARGAAFQILSKLRRAGFAAETDFSARSLRGQMKLADKLGAAFTVVLGPDELKENRAVIREMSTGNEQKIALDKITEHIRELRVESRESS